jgi:hypothetical protein
MKGIKIKSRKYKATIRYTSCLYGLGLDLDVFTFLR